VCNSRNGENAWCNNNNSECVFVFFLKNDKSLFLVKKTKLKKTRWFVYFQKADFSQPCNALTKKSCSVEKFSKLPASVTSPGLLRRRSYSASDPFSLPESLAHAAGQLRRFGQGHDRAHHPRARSFRGGVLAFVAGHLMSKLSAVVKQNAFRGIAGVRWCLRTPC